MPTASAMTATPFGAMRGHFRSLLAQFGLTSKSEEIRADLEAKVRLGLTRFKRSKVAGDHMSWEEFRWEYANKRLSTLKPGSAAHAEKRNKCATVVIHDPGSVAIATGPAPAAGGAAGLFTLVAIDVPIPFRHKYPILVSCFLLLLPVLMPLSNQPL